MLVTHLRTTDHCIDRWTGLKLHCIQLFPDPRFLLFLLQNTVGYKKKKCGPRGVALMAGMAEMEVSPQDEMANPQVMKMFAVERHGLPECFVSFRALCGVQSLSPVFGPNRPIVWGPLQCSRHRERLCSSGSRFPELNAQVRRPNPCTSRGRSLLGRASRRALRQ